MTDSISAAAGVPPSGGSSGRNSAGTTGRVRSDDYAVSRARSIIEQEIADGLRASERVKELEDTLSRQGASLALADDRCIRLSEQLRSASAERDGFMRFSASAAQSLDLVGKAVEAASAAIRDSGHVVDKAVTALREQADKLHNASQLLDALSGIIESAKTEARTAAYKQPVVAIGQQGEDRHEPADDGAARVVENLKGADDAG